MKKEIDKETICHIDIYKCINTNLQAECCEATHSFLGSLPQDFGVQVLHPGLSHSGKEVLTEQQSDLSHFGSHQGHSTQG